MTDNDVENVIGSCWISFVNRYRRKRPKVDASIFDSALSLTGRSDVSEKREENSVPTFGRFRLWTSLESSPVRYDRVQVFLNTVWKRVSAFICDLKHKVFLIKKIPKICLYIPAFLCPSYQ